MKRTHWLAKINEVKLDHFPLIDFHCSLYVDSHVCKFPLPSQQSGRPSDNIGLLTTLGQVLPMPPGCNKVLEEIHTEATTTASHMRVNHSQHICEQGCPPWILMKSHLSPHSVASWLWPHSQLRCPVGTKTYSLPDSTSHYFRDIAFYKKCHPSSAKARKCKSLPRSGADILGNWMLPL